MSDAEHSKPTNAERNWTIVRDRLRARIGRNRQALARLAGEPIDTALSHDDSAMIADAETLLAHLEQSEQQLDQAFAKRALRVGETSPEPERRDSDMHAYQSR